MNKAIISTLLRKVADDIDTGNCNLSEEEVVDVFSMLSHIAMSKEQSYTFLNISRSTFDDYVLRGILPKGRKRRGFKELVWYRDELIIGIEKMK